MMRVVVLASGSEGNATYIETDEVKLIIDLGKNAKYIKSQLENIGISPNEIDYILISHTHKDHTSALKTFVNHYKTTVLLSEKMFYDLEDIKDYENIIIYDDDIYLKDIKITSIKSSHDAVDSRNFIIESRGHSVVYVTDTGYINRKYFKMLENREIYLFESNHDIEMLLNGPYPKWLKTRVVGSYGHLSNKDSAFYLSKLIGSDTKKVVLMHLSHINNTEEKALEMINETFKEYEIDFNNVVCAKQSEITEVV
jgi:phosphoribosyl 1,2-cyclic phosphodiesterase